MKTCSPAKLDGLDSRGASDHAFFFALGSDHEARCVAEKDDREAVRFAQLHEAGRFVGCGRVDGAAEMVGVVGDDADGHPFDPGQGGDHAVAPLRS